MEIRKSPTDKRPEAGSELASYTVRSWLPHSGILQEI